MTYVGIAFLIALAIGYLALVFTLWKDFSRKDFFRDEEA